MSSLNAVSPVFVAAGVTYFIHSSVIVLAALALQRIIPFNRWRDVIWKWALLFPIFTTVIQLPFGDPFSFSIADSKPAIVSLDQMPDVNAPGRETQPECFPEAMDGNETAAITASFSAVTEERDEQSNQSSNNIPLSIRTEPKKSIFDRQSALSPANPLLSTSTPIPRPATTPTLFVAIFGSVSMLLLLRTILLGLRLRRALMRVTIDSSGPVRQTVDSLAKEAKVSMTIRVGVGDVDQPFVCGLFRSWLVVPSECVNCLAPDELKALVAHELGHLRRSDPAWLWLSRIVADLTWFQPFNRLVLREFTCSSERCSDDWAVENGIDAFVLARCLTNVSEWAARRSVPLASFAMGAMGARSRLATRIERLVESPQQSPSRIARLGMSLLCVSLTGLFPLILPRAYAEIPAISALRGKTPTSNRSSPENEPYEPSHGQPAPTTIPHNLGDVMADMRRLDELLAFESDPEIQKIAEEIRLRFQDVLTAASRSVHN